MNNPIYLVITMIIASLILYILISMNISLSDKLLENTAITIFYKRNKTAIEIMDYYLNKIGYRSKSNPLLKIDVNDIKFLGDVDDDGVIDTVVIKKGNLSQYSQNPNDYELTLSINGSESKILPSGLIDLSFKYLDSKGDSTSEILLVKQIRYSLLIESESKLDDFYLQESYTNLIKPKNLN